MDVRLNLMDTATGTKELVKYIISANPADHGSQRFPINACAGPHPRQPDQRVRLLRRHAHEGRRRGR